MSEKTKKIIIVSAIALLVIVCFIIIFCNIGVETLDDAKNNATNEIVPEEEISDVQLRETTIELYYINQNNEVVCEIRKIDSKILLENPYMETLNMLLDGPKYDNLSTAIPDGVKINNIEKKGDCLTIDFSKEFVENQTDNLETQGLVINQIVNTMTQFTEINNVKILVDGRSDVSFEKGNINFEQIFTRDF